MTTLEQYYNQHILPQTQGFDKSVCVPFEQLTDEQKKAFENTLNYQMDSLGVSSNGEDIKPKLDEVKAKLVEIGYNPVFYFGNMDIDSGLTVTLM